MTFRLFIYSKSSLGFLRLKDHQQNNIPYTTEHSNAYHYRAVQKRTESDNHLHCQLRSNKPKIDSVIAFMATLNTLKDTKTTNKTHIISNINDKINRIRLSYDSHR